MSVDIEMRIGRAGQDGVRARDDVDFGEVRQAHECQLGIRLADIDDGDVPRGHGI